MYKKYMTNTIIILALIIAMILWNIHAKQEALNENESDININTVLKNDDFEFVFNEPIYYPEEDLIYFQLQQSLVNPLYISGENTFKVFDAEENELISEKVVEGKNYFSLENVTEILENNQYFRLALYNGDLLVIDALKMNSNLIIYEDLSDYLEEGKSRNEMNAEVKYFIYQYENDPMLEIENLPKEYTAEEFKGSVKDRHNMLVDILDQLEYNEESQDKIIKYFESEIPKNEYIQYTNSNVVSEKQMMYTEIMNDVQYNLSVEIVNLENELQSAGYVNEEDLSDLEAGKNILEQRNILKEKLEEYSNSKIGTFSD